MAKWTLYDPVTVYTYTFQANPDGEALVAAKTLTYESTAAPSGGLLVYEGNDQPTTLTLSGTLLSVDQYHNMMDFYAMRHQVQLTDDLNRVRWVYITSFAPTRVRSATFPWKATFSLVCYVLAETLGTNVFNANPVLG